MARRIHGKGTYPGGPWEIPGDVAERLPMYFTQIELARHLSVSRAAVSKWVKRGGPPAYWQDGGPYSGCYITMRSDFLEWALRTGRYEGPAFWRPLLS